MTLALTVALATVAVIALARWNSKSRDAQHWMNAYFDNERDYQKLAEHYLKKTGEPAPFPNRTPPLPLTPNTNANPDQTLHGQWSAARPRL